MWLLKKLNDDTTKYLISDHRCYTVGRKNCDIILEEDSSVSRKHCTIYIAKRNECPFEVNALTGVWAVDEESKYGTYLKVDKEWVKLNGKQNQKLTDGSVIKFGLMGNIWILQYKPVIACPSGIQTEHKKEIESSLKEIDGFLTNVWCKECSVVIVNEVTLTVKVVLALINGTPIVTQKYIKKLVESIKNQSGFPNHEDFRPEKKESILDAALVSLDVKDTRKELFKGKKFVIPTKTQLEALKEVILSAGGKTELFSNTADLKQYAEGNTIMIQMPLNNKGVPQELEKSFEKVVVFLKNKHGMRIIPESEIALAVAYSSTEKYCNPQSNCFSLKRTIKEHDPGVLLVEETPDMSQPNISEACIGSSSSVIDSHKYPNESDHQKKSNDRKRNHSPEQSGYEFQLKRTRNKSGSADTVETPSLEKESVYEKNAINVTSSKKNISQHSCITNYFKKQSKPQVSKPEEPNNKKCETPKRKLSSESDSTRESSSRKKIKYPTEEIQQRPAEAEKPREADKPSQTKQYKNLSPPPIVVHNLNDLEEDLVDFIERDDKELFISAVENLNDTIFSLALVPSVFIKADGSLNEPPIMPVNVKHFRSKKENTSMITTPLENEDEELLDGDWLEPNPI